MSQFPSLPLFTDAFLADTGHLTAHQTGAYMLLLMMAWRTPGCRLPDDDVKLARWARCDARVWRQTKPAVMEFWVLADGFWTQKRLTSEYLTVCNRAERARLNGQSGGRPKLLQNNDPGNPAGSSRVTQKKAPNPNPNKNKYSDTDVSVADHAATPPDLSPSDVIWQKFPRLFADLAGKPEASVRTWIGKVLKQHSPESALAAFEAAAMARTGDPFGYATRALQSRPPPMNGHGRPRSQADIFTEIALDANERLNRRNDDEDGPFDGEVIPFGARAGWPGDRHADASDDERLRADRRQLSPESHSRIRGAFG